MRLTILGNAQELAPRLESLSWVSNVHVVSYDRPLRSVLGDFSEN